MPGRVKIALCQMTSLPSIEDNFARFEQEVSVAASAGCQLVCFPEYFLQGLLEDLEHREKIAMDDVLLERSCAIARKYTVDVVIGTIVAKHQRQDSQDSKTFNTAFYIDKSGSVLGKYRKRNLWHPEKDYLHPGTDDHLVFDTSFGRVGLLICWDFAWPEAFRALLVQDVELIIVPTYWTANDVLPAGRALDPEGEAESSWLDALVITRAYENQCVIAFVNCGGPKVEGFLGRSAIAAPLQGVLARAKGCNEETVMVEVDLDITKTASKVYQIKEDYANAKMTDGWRLAGDLR